MVYRIITTNAHNPLASIHKNLLDIKPEEEISPKKSM